VNGLQAQSKASPVIGWITLVSAQACFGVALPPFLTNGYTAVARSSLLRVWARECYENGRMIVG